MQIIPVILAGGAGSRLWPVSRMMMPKQLLPMLGEQTMLQDTVYRVSEESTFAAPIIVANEAHRFIVAEQLRAVGVSPRSILLEPEGRNTAPAALLAALLITADDEDALMLLLPSDHEVRDTEAFLDSVRRGVRAAEKDRLVTFGILPKSPKSGYGYIKQGAALEDAQGVYGVDAFVEKPDRDTAQEYLDSGDYLWNSGMFLMSARTFIQIAEGLIPEAVESCREAIAGLKRDFDFDRIDEKAFLNCPSISIDYGVMEKSQQAAVVPCDIGWSDVGAWSSIWESSEKDADGNVACGDVIQRNVKNCLLRADGPAIAALGIEDIVVVTTKDMVLVLGREHAEEVKRIAEDVQAKGHDEDSLHQRVFRPWGSYEIVDSGPRFQTKRLIVSPGGKLSLQKHAHRSEHWVVVQGTAMIRCGDDERMLNENESVYIPAGAVHRLENQGEVDVHIIEVQTGSYLGEDDIERLEDIYGRLGKPNRC